MAYRIILALAAVVLMAPAAVAQPGTPDTFQFLTQDQLQAQLPAGKSSAFMARHDNYMSVYSDRTGTNNVEMHQHWSHFVQIISGEGTLTYGGTVVGGKEISPGEVLGGTIQGGTTITLHPGDYVQIPAGTAHQFIVPQGSHLRYFLMDVHV